MDAIVVNQKSWKDPQLAIAAALIEGIGFAALFAS
jgi:hypothetical protein